MSPQTPFAPVALPRHCLLIAWCAVCLLIGLLGTFGFQFGVGDHWVLMPVGISWADPTAFRTDWFTHSAPQPHWFFDCVQWAGEKLGALVWVHAAYFLISVLIFAWASVLLVEKYFRGESWPLLAQAVIAVSFSTDILGSTSPLLTWALPHMLGGCLLYLGVAALVTGRSKLLALTMMATVVAHVQHGFHLTVLVLVALVFCERSSPLARSRFPLLVLSAMLLAAIRYIAGQRGLADSGSDFVEICARWIPFHCHAPSWRVATILQSLFVVTVPTVALAASHPKDRNLKVVTLVPLLILWVGVWADYFSVPLLAFLAKRFDIFRWVTLLFPLGALGIVTLLEQGLSAVFGRRATRWDYAKIALGILSWQGWDRTFLFPSSTLGKDAQTIPFVWWELIALGLFLFVRQRRADAGSGGRLRQIGRVGLLGLVMLAPFLVKRPPGSAFALGELQRDYRYHKSLGRLLPVDAIIVAPLDMGWVRYVFRRGTIADSKSIPYGGRPYREWKKRRAAVQAFFENPAARFADMQRAYHFTHVLWDAARPFPVEALCPKFQSFPVGIRPFVFSPLKLYECPSHGASFRPSD